MWCCKSRRSFSASSLGMTYAPHDTCRCWIGSRWCRLPCRPRPRERTTNPVSIQRKPPKYGGNLKHLHRRRSEPPHSSIRLVPPWFQWPEGLQPVVVDREEWGGRSGIEGRNFAQRVFKKGIRKAECGGDPILHLDQHRRPVDIHFTQRIYTVTLSCKPHTTLRGILTGSDTCSVGFGRLPGMGSDAS